MLSKNQLFIIFLVFAALICQFDRFSEAKQFQFKYYSFRRKQRNARKYKLQEEECEARSCGEKVGLEKTKCTRKCISQQCYTELYAWDELEEGEIDVRQNSFKGCYMKELQEMEMTGLL